MRPLRQDVSNGQHIRINPMSVNVIPSHAATPTGCLKWPAHKNKPLGVNCVQPPTTLKIKLIAF